MFLQYPHMGVAYHALCQEVLHGDEVAPRGLRTRELLSVTVALADPLSALAVGVGRGLNTRFVAADALQVIGGFTDHAWAARFNPAIASYGEHGAYGPRLAPQMTGVLNRLRGDRDTRRAVFNIWDHRLDLAHPEAATDFPCTVWGQFMIRDDRLDLHVGMRANDLWLGFPYDVFTFTQLQVAAAGVLGVEPGTYYHHATSLHLYEKHWELADGVIRRDGAGVRVVGLAPHAANWSQVRTVAALLHAGVRVVESPWYSERLVVDERSGAGQDA